MCAVMSAGEVHGHRNNSLFSVQAVEFPNSYSFFTASLRWEQVQADYAIVHIVSNIGCELPSKVSEEFPTFPRCSMAWLRRAVSPLFFSVLKRREKREYRGR